MKVNDFGRCADFQYRVIEANIKPVQPRFDANNGKRLVGSVGQGK